VEREDAPDKKDQGNTEDQNPIVQRQVNQIADHLDLASRLFYRRSRPQSSTQMPQGADILIPVTKCDLQSHDCGSESLTQLKKTAPVLARDPAVPPTANLADKSFDCVPRAFQEVK
jgi:hypothetical protein